MHMNLCRTINIMRIRVILAPFLIIVHALTTFGLLTTTPLNQYTNPLNNNFTMRCASTQGSNSITWLFTPVGDTVNVTIASGSQVNPALTHLYWIDQPTGYDSNLVISTVNESTIGTFTCADNETLARAQLIMFHGIDAISNASGILIIGDVIRYSVNISYYGNPFFYPTCYFISFDENNIFDEYIANITSSQLDKLDSIVTATVTYYRTLSCRSKQYMQCNVYYGQPVGNLLPGSATNAPDNGLGSGLPNEKVSCDASVAGAVSETVLYSGAILTCALSSKLPVYYLWIELLNGASSTGPKLTVWQSGSYQCTALFAVNGTWESVSTSPYNLTVENLTSMAKPLHGPIAGGTKVTLTFENLSKQISNISAVYFGDILKVTGLQSDSEGDNVVLTTVTPNATAGLIGQPLPIIIELIPGPYNISTNLSFTYQGNPEITGISPSTFIVTGGTAVNVTGIQLASVANPLIQVTLIVERGLERNTTIEKSIEPCDVNADDGNQMTCRMPSVNIPDDFLRVLDSKYNNRSTRDTSSINHLKAENQFILSRRKRFVNALSLTGPNGVDKAFIYIGFILDGYQKYDNINDVLSDTQILIYSSPEINLTKHIIEFDPNKDQFISIMGKYMTRGCRMVDYLVQMGSGICENIDLTDNELRCRPPKQQPQSTQNGSIYCDQLLSIYIKLGFRTYQYACVKYSTRHSPTPTVLIIELVVGLSALVIVIILMMAIAFSCKRSRNRRPTSNTLYRNTREANEVGLNEQPAYQSYARETSLYLQPLAQLAVNEAYIQPSTE